MKFSLIRPEGLNREISFRDDEDWQGIPWNTNMMKISRVDKRRERLHARTYRSFGHPLNFLVPPKASSVPFFTFFHNYERARCYNSHFQLRNNLVYEDGLYFLNANYAVEKFDPDLARFSTVQTSSHNFQLAVFDVKEKFMAVAGSMGELKLADMEDNTQMNLIQSANSDLVNAVHFQQEGSKLALMTSCNDRTVRIFELDRLDNHFVYEFPSSINAAAKRNTLIAGVLDGLEVPILDTRTGQIEMELQGHLDDSFGVEWDPCNDFYLATCGQDHSTRIWDIRTREVVHTLCGVVGAVLKLEYSPCGKYLAFLEGIDFVHVYDTRDFQKCQVIDLFGEMSGLCFSRDTQSLFVGVTDHHFKSILEFRNAELNEISNSIF